MKNIVLPLQSAFVPDRLINDNSIVAKEIFLYMKKKRGSGGLMAIKFGMEKAYDQVEWPFLIKCSSALASLLCGVTRSFNVCPWSLFQS